MVGYLQKVKGAQGLYGATCILAICYCQKFRVLLGGLCWSRSRVAVGCYLTGEACPKRDQQAFPPLLLPWFLLASPCPQKGHKKTVREESLCFFLAFREPEASIHTCFMNKQDCIKDMSHV